MRCIRSTCRMRVPMVICPCGELFCRASVMHLMTMDVLDIETCAAPQDTPFAACTSAH